ncbi:MAG TPA: sugar ABC transporter permease [Ktedonobacteraceae bacterium]|nr:sugar ABC transporter permease [Ktedonobacteraceae bacterium]
MSAIMKVSKTARRSNWFAVLWTAPALIFYIAFAIIPLFIALYYSFTRWNGLAPAQWIGLGNWFALFSDQVTLTSLLLTIQVMVISWIVQTPISMLLGVFMAGKQFYRSVFGVLYFLPLLFSAVAIALTWQNMLDPNFGVVNPLLAAMGLSGLARVWLGDPHLAFYVVMVIVSWQFIPFHALLYLGGARQIPKELYEAANIDGGGRIQNFFAITLPQLKYTIITSTTLIFTGSLTYFDLFWVTTQGGPGYATRVLPLQMYITAFLNEQVGYGSMVAVVLAVFGLALSFILLRFSGFSKMSSQLEGL